MRTSILMCAALCGLTAGTARADESGFSIYGLGGYAFGAGVTPPPGWYVTPFAGYYSGKASATLPFAGLLTAALHVHFFQAGLNTLYVPDTTVLGGYLGFSVSVPTGHIGLAGSIVAGPLSVGKSVSGWGLGDISAKAQLGWTMGEFSDTVAITGWAPTGRYEVGFEPNIGLNRPALDATWAFSWLDKNTNLEFSGAAGFTVNHANTATDYKSGNDAHFEWAIGKKFENGLEIGPVGYFDYQLTGDSGIGAVLGAFQGRVIGIGPGMSYTTLVGKNVLVLNARYYQEFDVQNRFTGSTSLLSATVRF